MTASLEINEAFFQKIDGELSKLPHIGRMPVIEKGGKKAGKVVEARCREVLPKPGYPGDKPGLKPLRETLETKMVRYKDGRMLVFMVGFAWGAGSHGHLVEEGHRMVVGGKAPRKSQQRVVVAPAAVLSAMKLSPTGERTGGVVGFVEGQHYLAHSAKATESQQAEAILGAVKEAIEETKR
jgi:hypothetical protein